MTYRFPAPLPPPLSLSPSLCLFVRLSLSPPLSSLPRTCQAESAKISSSGPSLRQQMLMSYAPWTGKEPSNPTFPTVPSKGRLPSPGINSRGRTLDGGAADCGASGHLSGADVGGAGVFPPTPYGSRSSTTCPSVASAVSRDELISSPASSSSSLLHTCLERKQSLHQQRLAPPSQQNFSPASTAATTNNINNVNVKTNTTSNPTSLRGGTKLTSTTAQLVQSGNVHQPTASVAAAAAPGGAAGGPRHPTQRQPRRRQRSPPPGVFSSNAVTSGVNAAGHIASNRSSARALSNERGRGKKKGNLEGKLGGGGGDGGARSVPRRSASVGRSSGEVAVSFLQQQSSAMVGSRRGGKGSTVGFDAAPYQTTVLFRDH